MNSDEIYCMGKRFFYNKFYAEALEYLSEACTLIARENGDLCDEMVNPHFYYSQCLYENVKSKSDLIGERKINVDKVVEVDENNDISNGEGCKVTEMLKKSDQTGDGIGISKSHDVGLEESKIQDGGVEESKIKDGGVEESKIKDGGLEESNIKDGEGASNDNEEIGDLQLARETIECAILIIDRRLKAGIIDKLDLQVKLAQCYDVEEKVLNKAMVEFKTALAFRIKYLLPTAPDIAESYYNIALLYDKSNEVLMALENLIKCRDALLLNRDEFVNREDIVQTDNLIYEVDERIIEAELSQAEYLKSKAGLAKQVVKPMLDAATSDITHLVRKKTRNNDDDAPPSKVAKKDF